MAYNEIPTLKGHVMNKNILTPGVIDIRTKNWTEWHTNSTQRLVELKEELDTKLTELIDEKGNYTNVEASDVSKLVQLAYAFHFEARNDLQAIEWSVEDYQDLLRSKTFRIAMKIRNRFKK